MHTKRFVRIFRVYLQPGSFKGLRKTWGDCWSGFLQQICHCWCWTNSDKALDAVWAHAAYSDIM